MLLDLAHLDLPLNAEQLFGRAGRLVMEVGFGDGWFLAHLARDHPAWNLLGAEVSLGSVTRTLKRMRRERIAHVRLYVGQAGFVVRNLLPPCSLHRIYVNFPDPWPKKRHHERRLLRAPFFRLLSTRLADGGALWFTTDHAEYFAFALDQARSTGLFALAQGPPPPATLQTKYARKWRAQAIPIQHATFTKVAEADDPFPLTVETYDAMHHALLAGSLPPIESFDRLVHPFAGGHVIVLEAMRPVGEDGLVFVTRIEEEDLTQEALIEARPAHQGPGDVFVGIKPFGQPLVTRGTQEAVRVVTEWLEQHGLRLVQRFF
jgi:tRNA (guanine-N7-)-methyltransferase